MEIALAFGILWVIFAILMVLLSDKWSTLILLAFNLTIAAFLLTETDLAGALVKTVLGIISPVIVLLAISRTKQPQPKFGVPTLILGSLLALVLSYLAAYLLQSQFPVGRTTETYVLIALFSVALLMIISQKSILKILLGILILENVGTLLLTWGENTAIFGAVAEVFVVLITLTIALIAVMDFAEYETIDSSKLTRLRG